MRKNGLIHKALKRAAKVETSDNKGFYGKSIPAIMRDKYSAVIRIRQGNNITYELISKWNSCCNKTVLLCSY